METIKNVRKMSRPDGWSGSIFFARLFRPLGIFVAWLFLHTNITANQVTALSIVLGLIAGLLFVPINPWTTVLAAVILFLAIVLDFADGSIARYRKTANVTGWYCDSTAHTILTPWLLACVTFRSYFIFGSIVPLILGFSGAVFYMVVKELTWSEYYAEIYSKLFKTLRERHFIVSGENMKWQTVNTPLADRVEHLKKNRLFHLLSRWGKKSVLGDYAQPMLISTAIVDALMMCFVTDNPQFSLLYLVVIVAGIVNPMLSLWFAFSSVVTNQSERIYRKLLTEIAEAQGSHTIHSSSTKESKEERS